MDLNNYFKGIKMLKNFLTVLSILLALSACNKNASRTNAHAEGGAHYGQNVPGSQEDLIVQAGDRVFFDFDSSSLSADAKLTLDKQVKWLAQYSDKNIVVEGHTDDRGTREYNLALGERRANAVKNYLISAGVAKARVSTVSYGKERPAVVGEDESSWGQNRRGVTTIN